jgi:hypothetical protein
LLAAGDIRLLAALRHHQNTWRTLRPFKKRHEAFFWKKKPSLEEAKRFFGEPALLRNLRSQEAKRFSKKNRLLDLCPLTKRA